MNEQELAMSALKHAKATSWSWDKYLLEVRNNPSYNYKATEWYKAGADLQAAKSAPAPPPASSLADAQARMFLAQNPLDCLQAGLHMIPVCTADPNYRHFYTADVISKLRGRFKHVEAWCDCSATSYQTAKEMVSQLGLDGPAWGQCENTTQYDQGYMNGARRMVGQIAGLRADQKEKIGTGEVHLAFELYRNVMPWQVPDYEDLNAGVGGNCIACYASSSEGAVYTPVSDYIDRAYYVPGRDSVYAVGLTPTDWLLL